MGSAMGAGTGCCSDLTRSGTEVPRDDQTIKFLSQVKLFKRLPAQFHPQLASVSQKVTFAKGELIIKQGDEGTEFFIIVSGTAEVRVEDKAVAQLKGGDYFGENALLRNEPRNATIAALGVVTLLKITRDQFRKLGLQEKLEFQKRGAVAGGNNREVKVKAPSPKTAEERQLMQDALLKNTNVKTMVDLQPAQLNGLIDIAWKEQVSSGTELIKQGDLDADYFYIVQEGTFDVLVSEKGEKSSEAVCRIEKGGSFGEMALLYFAPRAATVKACSKSAVWVIDRKNFKDILIKAGTASAKQHAAYLKKVDLLASLKDEELGEVAKHLEVASFGKGDVIMKQGDIGQNIYILISGQVSVLKNGKEEAKLTGSDHAPCVFGEMALLSDTPRTATIEAVSDVVKALTLDRKSFDMLLGPLKEITQRGKDGKSRVGRGAKDAAKEVTEQSVKRGVVKKKDLQRLGLLGCGGFGSVELVEHAPSGETYALKTLSKGYLVKSGMQTNVMNEKAVQLLCDTPFTVRLHETYNGDQSLYFLLELALGGEIYELYNKHSLFGKEAHAKFYVAGVVYAFDHMHEKKIIFRDLKPENLLLNSSGYVKVADMGLAKICAGKTFTTCGTPDYFAPELIESLGHTRALDWWTLGILTFELLAGAPPFESASPMQVYQKVIRGIGKIPFPKAVRAAEEVIKGLCQPDPSERLPMKVGGIGNVQKSRWYKGFDWPGMLEQKMNVPFKPSVKNKKDAGNFAARKEDLPPQILYKDPKTGWDEGFATSE